ncbi:MAG: hypothetical protein AUK31_01685 [Fibrobacteres bacterium CG2_30_45_31]|nr:MAG: hypothetical protein AUK31_01685 [Fibrobacteres bacterium CG2_30_45_31]
MTEFRQPLSIHFVWHPGDSEQLENIIDFCSKSLKRDPEKPFSRSISIPLFFLTSEGKNPPEMCLYKAEKTIVFVFISKRIVADDAWTEFIEKLKGKCDAIVPIALDSTAFNIDNSLNSYNFIRAYEYEAAFYRERILIAVAHEIYRLALNESLKEMNLGKDSAVRIFLSHAKDAGPGISIAETLKNFLDQSVMRNFFDAFDIAPGYCFDAEIEAHIKESTLVAIHSDPYSSRYWCQREIGCAKAADRPMIAVDALNEYEDRRFPLAANIPGIRVRCEKEEKISESDVLRIMICALLETIRFFYSRRLLSAYQESGWIPKGAILLQRPPELADVQKYSGGFPQTKEIYYPEPTIFQEEADAFKKIGFTVLTPLSAHRRCKPLKIGLSFSEPDKNSLTTIAQRAIHLQQLSQDLARNLITGNNRLIYGGDLRPKGFTECIYFEALATQTRLRSNEQYLTNYLAWPLYLNPQEPLVDWKARFRDIAVTKTVKYPDDVDALIFDKEHFLPPVTKENWYVWSRCLTQMRNEMIKNCDLRICAGGRLTEYKGKMPGVLEEIFIAFKEKKPLFLLGGFGGVTESFCQYMEIGKAPDNIKKEWQIGHNLGYRELLDFADQFGMHYADTYNLPKLNFDMLNNGLDENDNKKLFHTTFTDEIIFLIQKGIENKFSH